MVGAPGRSTPGPVGQGAGRRQPQVPLLALVGAAHPVDEPPRVPVARVEHGDGEVAAGGPRLLLPHAGPARGQRPPPDGAAAAPRPPRGRNPPRRPRPGPGRPRPRPAARGGPPPASAATAGSRACTSPSPAAKTTRLPRTSTV